MFLFRGIIKVSDNMELIMKKLNLQATHNLYIYIYRFLASCLFVLGFVFVSYADDIFTEPKASFGGDSGMSSPDKQYIESRLKSLEDLILSKMNAMETRVNTAISSMGAGMAHKYHSSCYSGKDYTDCTDAYLVCPLGKSPNIVKGNSYSGGRGETWHPGNPPCR